MILLISILHTGPGVQASILLTTLSYFIVLKISGKQILRFNKDFLNDVKRWDYLLNLSNMRSNADHSPDITNMTAPTGTITTIRKIITSQPISLPGYFFEALFTVPTSLLLVMNGISFCIFIVAKT